MKNLRILLSLMALSLLTGACLPNTDLPVRSNENRLTATIGDASATKTMLTPEEDGVSKVYWSEEDKIGVYVDGDPNKYVYRLVDGAGTKKAVFSGFGSGASYIAVYPETAGSGLIGDSVSLTLPAEQHYTRGTFENGSYPMVAVSTTTDLSFRNLCSVLKLSLTGNHIVTGLVFRTNDESVKVSGPATVSLADPGNPELILSEDGCDSLVFQVDNLMLDNEKPTDFFLVLPAQTYKDGFTVRVYTSTGYMDKRLTTDFTMERSRKHDAKPFAVKLDAGVEPSSGLNGSGTAKDPFRIATLGDLLLMRSAVNNDASLTTPNGNLVQAKSASYLLTADLDLSPLCSAETEENWEPIGLFKEDNTGEFSGSFDGGGHEITHLYYFGYDLGIGFFGTMSGNVRNLTISGEIRDYNSDTGLLAGSVTGKAQLENCVSRGSVDGTSCVGGLAGRCQGQVRYCRNEADVNGGSLVGGLAGLASFAYISHCTNAGSVVGIVSQTGGVAGCVDATRIYDCTNTGNVTGTGRLVGGIGGYFKQGGKVLNCINYGSVKGSEMVGGIGGLESSIAVAYEGAATIANSINLGKVEITEGRYVGALAGFIGLQEDESPLGDEPADAAWVQNCYWQSDVNPGMPAVGGGLGVEGQNYALTEAQLKGAPYEGVLYATRDGGYSQLIDALNAGAVAWSKTWNLSLSGWEYAAPDTYPVQTDLEARLPGDTKPIFDISKNEFDFNVTGGQFQVAVTSSADYSVGVLPDWISEVSVEAKPGQPHTRVHTFAVAANTTGKAREKIIVFTNAAGTALKVTVNQKAPYLTLSETEVSFSAAASSKRIVVSSSIDWVVTAGQQAEWISVSPRRGIGDGIVIIDVDENKASSARAGSLVIAAADGTVEYMVSFIQSGASGEENEAWKELPFYHQSLAMRFTATWCTWCPYMGAAISRAQELYPGKILHLALHGGGSDLQTIYVSSLMGYYNGTGFPTGIVDGRRKITNSEYVEEVAAGFIAALQETEENYETASGLAIRSTTNGQKVSIDIDAYFKTAGDYKITVFLLEDGIVHPQVNGGDNYVHNHVAREVATDILGEAFTIKKDLTKKSFYYEVSVDPAFKLENMHVLAYIQKPFGSAPRLQTEDYGDYYVDNCATAPVGDELKLALVGGSSGGGGGQGNEGVTPGGEIK